MDGSGTIVVTGRSYVTWGAPLNPHSGDDDLVVLKLTGDATPPADIPTLSEWAQIGMAALLVGGGLLARRKRSAV